MTSLNGGHIQLYRPTYVDGFFLGLGEFILTLDAGDYVDRRLQFHNDLLKHNHRRGSNGACF